MENFIYSGGIPLWGGMIYCEGDESGCNFQVDKKLNLDFNRPIFGLYKGTQYMIFANLNLNIFFIE